MLKRIRHHIHLTQRDEGFTLVELVVAMLILAGVLLTLIAVQISAAATIVDARKREQATAIANQAMEQMRSIPWAYLSKGMYNGFLAAAGGDSHVTGGNILVLPSGNKTLVVAPSNLGNQNLSEPRVPLFDASGSHHAQVTDVAQTNTLFDTWAYVTQPAAGGVNTVDIVVIVEWKTNKGATAQTIVESTAFRGTGCGNDSTTPYLTACQANFDATSSSGQITTQVIATEVPDGVNDPAVLNLLYPTADPFYSLAMRSASATASVQSQQVALVTGAVLFGGTVTDDLDPATEPQEEGWLNGYATDRVTATDDVTQHLTNTPPYATKTITQGIFAEDEWNLDSGGHPISFLSRSDFRRPVTVTASTNLSCKPGVIPVNQPCAISDIGNEPSYQYGSGYILMNVGPQLIRLSRRTADLPPPANADQAWVARFKSTASSSSAVGCQTLTGAGCVSAGASRSMAKLSIGKAINSTWTANAAPDGIIMVEGASGCAGGVNAGFTETVLAQRGSSQKLTAGSFTRCGQVRYWTGGAYSTATFSAGASGPFTTAPVSWTDGTYAIQATGTVTFAAGTTENVDPDDNCRLDACSVTVQSGSINISVTYLITTPTGTYVVISTTVVDGPSANVVYKEAPNA